MGCRMEKDFFFFFIPPDGSQASPRLTISPRERIPKLQLLGPLTGSDSGCLLLVPICACNSIPVVSSTVLYCKLASLVRRPVVWSSCVGHCLASPRLSLVHCCTVQYCTAASYIDQDGVETPGRSCFRHLADRHRSPNHGLNMFELDCPATCRSFSGPRLSRRGCRQWAEESARHRIRFGRWAPSG